MLTPLQGEINLAIRLILVIVAYLELLLAASAALNGLPFGEGVAQATVVAGLVPNGLLLAIAVAYALGAVRIVRLGALVQQGLLLVIFVEPPTAWWAGGDVLSGDRRPTLLAMILFVALVAVMATPLARRFFELQPLDPADVVLVTAAALVWTVAVRAAWRHRVLERFVGAR